MRINKTLSLLLLTSTALLCACTTTPVAAPTTYKAATTKGTYGYSNVKLSDNEYRVLFKATDKTSADIVQQYALRRAAELAHSNQFSWIEVVKTDVDKKRITARAISTDNKKPAPFSQDRLCTMSGCSEVAQPMPVETQNQVTETQMNDIYFSIVVRMGNSQEGLGKQAISVEKILNDKADDAGD